jgi:hypothetical protein
MRIALALIASVTALGLATPSTAQVISISQVLADCPDFALAQACPSVATEFLDDRRPGTQRNGQVVNLVIAIADAAQPQTVPRPVCLNAAEGLRVLATGVTNDDQAKQINDIADALCLGNRTAAIRGPGGLFDSLAGGGGTGGGGGGGGGGDPVVVPDPGGGGGGGGGGLGSNDAGHGNETAMAHANENALNNEHGNNAPKD